MMNSQIDASLLLNSFFRGTFAFDDLHKKAKGLKLPAAPFLPALTLNFLWSMAEAQETNQS
jgi:hypothetical protein